MNWTDFRRKADDVIFAVVDWWPAGLVLAGFIVYIKYIAKYF